MKQVLQNVKDRKLSMVEVPPPALQPRGIRVRTAASLISAGTERMIVDLANRSLVGKARARPDLVRQVIDKARTEGIINTVKNVRSKLERPVPLGYSAAGVVEQVGEEATGFRIGDRVAIAGAGYANHADINYVPVNLAAHIPDGVSYEDAAYTTVASIAMQGIRLAKPELGEHVAVIGLGLIGLIAVQLLKANGCRVVGVDLDSSKLRLAERLGADVTVNGCDDVVGAVRRFTKGRFADRTVIAAATKSNAPVVAAGEITRRRGQVIVVGAVGMDIPREQYYKKELAVSISMSYGPGRYDPQYEEAGIDYPYDFVRWTEQRNMEAVLALLESGNLDVRSLTTHRVPFADALHAYDQIRSNSEPYVGIVLEYDLGKDHSEVVAINRPKHVRSPREGALRVGFVGAGNYAALHLLPNLARSENVQLVGLATATGLNAKQKAEKFGFHYATSDVDHLVSDEAIDAVFIGTRHATHAEYVVKALNAGKNAFVEKPLVVSTAQLDEVVDAYTRANETCHCGLSVGLNRRFAPLSEELCRRMPRSVPRQMNYRVNAGNIPTSSWLHQESEGGGMLIGEMCHFLDLMQFIAGSRPHYVFASSMTLNDNEISDADNVTITIAYKDGSTGVLSYNTVGSKSLSKERLEVFADGTVAILDDFRVLTVYDGSRRTRRRSANQDKGQRAMLAKVVDCYANGAAEPIPFDQLVQVMRTVFAAKSSLKSRSRVDLA